MLAANVLYCLLAVAGQLATSSLAISSSGNRLAAGVSPAQQVLVQPAQPAAVGGQTVSNSAGSIGGQANQAQAISSGAQLFQSPAALAAAAQAATASSLSVQPSLMSAGQQSQQQQTTANMLSPAVVPSVVSPRIDTAEILKQAQQMTSQQQQQQYNIEQECAVAGGFISFELITGYVLSAPADAMVMQPGTLQLTDCLNICRQNSSCLAINFETGLCVLLQESADKNPQALQKSQFPVFTIYAHKICLQECAVAGGFISFELITGYVLSAPADAMVMQPGTLQLTDCLNICRQNSSCLAINFETGLCVLLQESADKNPQALQKSQFPVFTIYAHKICLQGDRTNRCHRSWSFERVIGWVLQNLEKRTLLTKTRIECLLACYNEQSFQCKSFNYDSASGSCQLSDMDRHSLPSAMLRRRHYVESSVDTIDYGENNCIQEARGICDFKPFSHRILKTVDSIYQDVKSEPECRKRCLQAPYRCHSYDMGDSSNPVCRTSHLDRNSLQQIHEPYLEIQGAVTYELDSCYNVTVVCKSREMVARVKTNKIFNGKIYAKNAPLSCLNDITNSMDFELSMAFNDACSISRSAINNGVFTNEIVLQHNDMIVTNSDMGLNIKCQYDLRNQTVYNNINLEDFMTGREPIDITSQSAVVRSPNISMQILRNDGNHIAQAQVGDALMLRFQITDDRSPFEIFVRDLYAMDGVGGAEIMLIDAEGCPTDPSIMTAMLSSKGNGQTLEAQFDAFKFPTSETVAFRALVTPCIPHCEPVHCQNRVFDGTLYESESLGKRRRRKRSAALAKIAPGAPEEVMVRNSIEIRDKFFLDEEANEGRRNGQRYNLAQTNEDERRPGSILERLHLIGANSFKLGGVAILFCALLASQSILFIGWALIWRRRYLAASNVSCSISLQQKQQQQLSSRCHLHPAARL